MLPFQTIRPVSGRSIRSTERVADADINPSVGTVGASDDNALAETVIGLFKTDFIKQLGPLKNSCDGEWETVRWVDRHNEHRLLRSIGFIPPEEAETRILDTSQIIDQGA